jgi:hypothetical protein
VLSKFGSRHEANQIEGERPFETLIILVAVLPAVIASRRQNLEIVNKNDGSLVVNVSYFRFNEVLLLEASSNV